MEKNLASFIKKKIQTNLGLQDVEVINNSHLHQHHSSSPKNGNSHFQLIVSYKEMQGLVAFKYTKKFTQS